MGWTSGDGGRAKVVAEFKTDCTLTHGGIRKTLKHHRHGDTDWFLVEDTATDGKVDRWICCMIWEGSAHKEMDEGMGPYRVGCPVAWFDEVPLPEFAEYAQAWRERNRKAVA